MSLFRRTPRRLSAKAILGYLAAREDREEFGVIVVTDIADALVKAYPLDSYVSGYLLGASGASIVPF